jgi:PAS domain S-box-containing protein
MQANAAHRPDVPLKPDAALVRTLTAELECGVVVVASTMLVVHVNDVAGRLLHGHPSGSGAGAAEASAGRLVELLRREGGAVERALRGRGVAHATLRWRRPDDSILPLTVAAAPVLDDDGGIEQVVCILRPSPAAEPHVARLERTNEMLEDLVEQRTRKAREAERAAQESEEFHRFAVEAGRIGTWNLDIAAARCVLSAQMVELMGYPEERSVVSVEEWMACVTPEDRPVVCAAIEALHGSDTPLELTFRIDRPDGDRRWLYSRGRITRDLAGEPLRMHGVSIDVTERVLAEHALRDTRDLLILAQEASQLGFGSWDPDSGAVAWDARSRAIMGLGEDQAVTLDSWFACVHPDDRDRVAEQALACMGDGSRFDVEHRVVWPNGEIRHVHTTGLFKTDADGRVLGSSGHVRDVTHQKQAEKRLRELSARLTTAEQQERRRLARVLHDDLQQILYGVEMKLEAVAGEFADAAPAALADIDAARRWLGRAIATARQLTVELSPPVLDQENVVDALEWLQRHMRELQGLEMVLEAPHRFPLPDAELRVLLFQIVRELVFNAKKHAGVDTVTVRLEDPGGRLVIHVIDRGRGCDPALLVAADGAGSGFGLLDARERLQLRGGELRVRGAPGQGTWVTAEVPV